MTPKTPKQRYSWYTTTTASTWPVWFQQSTVATCSSTFVIGCKCGCEREDDCHDKKKPDAG